SIIFVRVENDPNAATPARNINAEFGDGSVEERTIQCLYAKFESGVESHPSEHWRQLWTTKFYSR
ncbi:hypothetical protein TNCT_723431, partial [Trichonephila clavata]